MKYKINLNNLEQQALSLSFYSGLNLIEPYVHNGVNSFIPVWYKRLLVKLVHFKIYDYHIKSLKTIYTNSYIDSNYKYSLIRFEPRRKIKITTCNISTIFNNVATNDNGGIIDISVNINICSDKLEKNILNKKNILIPFSKKDTTMQVAKRIAANIRQILNSVQNEIVESLQLYDNDIRNRIDEFVSFDTCFVGKVGSRDYTANCIIPNFVKDNNVSNFYLLEGDCPAPAEKIENIDTLIQRINNGVGYSCGHERFKNGKYLIDNDTLYIWTDTPHYDFID